MMRIAMATVLLSALVVTATFASPAASACDMHGSGDYFFLSYLDLRDMTESEQRAAEQRAIEQFHAQQLETAKARFVGRFRPDPTSEPPKAGTSEQQTL